MNVENSCRAFSSWVHDDSQMMKESIPYVFRDRICDVVQRVLRDRGFDEALLQDRLEEIHLIPRLSEHPSTPRPQEIIRKIITVVNKCFYHPSMMQFFGQTQYLLEIQWRIQHYSGDNGNKALSRIRKAFSNACGEVNNVEEVLTVIQREENCKNVPSFLARKLEDLAVQCYTPRFPSRIRLPEPVVAAAAAAPKEPSEIPPAKRQKLMDSSELTAAAPMASSFKLKPVFSIPDVLFQELKKILLKMEESSKTKKIAQLVVDLEKTNSFVSPDAVVSATQALLEKIRDLFSQSATEEKAPAAPLEVKAEEERKEHDTPDHELERLIMIALTGMTEDLIGILSPQ